MLPALLHPAVLHLLLPATAAASALQPSLVALIAGRESLLLLLQASPAGIATAAAPLPRLLQLLQLTTQAAAVSAPASAAAVVAAVAVQMSQCRCQNLPAAAV
jgi:hypothetical protein